MSIGTPPAMLRCVSMTLLLAVAVVLYAAQPAAGASRQVHVPGRVHAAPKPSRFFFSGDGELRLAHAHFKAMLNVRYRRTDGTYDPQALAEIAHFFRSREDGREGPISLRLIELLGYVQTRFRPRQMTLLSGYRSPQFNADLRAAGQKAAQASLHTEGLAADVAVSGVDLRRLWLDLRTAQSGGAGYYRTGKFLHIDTGRARFWEETTSRVDENLAQGNARVFLRTDFDRYTRLEGAVLTVHSVTAFPLLVSRRATVAGSQGTVAALLAAADGTAPQGDCIALPEYAPVYQLRVIHADRFAAVPGAPGGSIRARIVLSTCEPRIEHTPPEIESNTVELTTP